MAAVRRLRSGEPREVAGYRLVGVLGDGGQGSVYLGEDAEGGRVAVKVLHARLVTDRRAVRRFLAEAETAEKVAGHGTARIIDAGVLDDRPYLISEYVDGPSLQQYVAEHGPLAGEELIRLAVATARSLAAIHEAQIVHRDFKPNNVLIGPDGPRVIDFGVARTPESATTATSSVVGTPGYMAPEQISGESASPASDLFSWASTMGYAATGVSLFGGDSIPAVMHRILTAEPDLSGVAEPLRSVLESCLAKIPAHRPSATEVLRALNRPTEATRQSSSMRRVRRRRRQVVVAGIALLAVTGGVIGLMINRPGDTPEGSSGTGEQVAGPLYFGLPEDKITRLATGSVGEVGVVVAANETKARIEIWNPADGEVMDQVPIGTKGVSALAFTKLKGLATIVWAGADGKVRTWRPSRGKTVETIDACKGPITMSLVPLKAEPAAYVSCSNGRLQGWDLATRKSAGLWQVGIPADAIAWAGTGTTVYTVGRKGTLQQINPSSAVKARLSTTKGPASGVQAVGGVVAVRVEGLGVELYDQGTQRLRCTVKVSGDAAAAPRLPATDFALTKNVLVTGVDGINVWDLRTCKRKERIADTSGPVSALAIGQVDGKQSVVLAYPEGEMEAWALEGR